ncbi:ribosomal protein L9 [Rubidibacter lacunae KORDI 51-2]|uniref:Large ribosomal subunit protein bL9 n=1 Tax=Rubidibacter lacunae KORDI 51-2 TaxID=582515 RepID=U5DT79_9CHRO|nr:50S ribosomal protein L9 [Rubidibacter lacunae]ERN42890.1 ribosomal protein L9 [Rubidibacter lacunae KORDI 51-2]
MPKRRQQVVLRHDVKKLGSTDDVVDVAPGYARNYLIPQGLAAVATPGLLRQVEQRKEKERQAQLALLKDAQDRKTALATVGRLTILKQVGEGDAIYGTVTTQDIAEAIAAGAGQSIDRRSIELTDDINALGVYKAEVKLHSEVSATVEFEVAPL